MNLDRISRRRLLRNATVAAALGSLGGAVPATVRAAEASTKPRATAGLNVRDFGAIGDGKADDTTAFTAAMKEAADAGGDLVHVPRGNYLIKGTLDVPESVTLEGVFRAPTARTQNRGSCLLAVAGAGIEVKETNRGPVKFTACGFWGIPTTDSHAILEGRGHTTFNGCHFVSWAKKDADAPCIHAKRGGLTVTACDFAERGKAQVAIESEVEAALVFGNRLRGKDRVSNLAGDRAQISLNVVSNQKT